MDIDGDGTISESELIKALVGLGLAPDHKFARKICLSLDPRGHELTAHQETELSMRDWLKIFEPDKVSDKIYKLLQAESMQLQLKRRTGQRCIGAA